jgi:uncharacterized protein (TIGR00369 family)
VGHWSDLLDAIRDGTAGDPPPCIANLDLPPIASWEPGRVRTEWTVNPDFFHERGALFGGYLAAIADSAVGLATMTVLEDDEAFTTADLRVSFFRPVTGGTLRTEANVVYRGRRMVHVEVTFERDDGTLAGRATATQAVIPVPSDSRS